MFCCLILGFTLESLWNPASNSLICLSHLDDFLYALSDDYMKMHFMSWERWGCRMHSIVVAVATLGNAVSFRCSGVVHHQQHRHRIIGILCAGIFIGFHHGQFMTPISLLCAPSSGSCFLFKLLWRSFSFSFCPPFYFNKRTFGIKEFIQNGENLFTKKSKTKTELNPSLSLRDKNLSNGNAIRSWRNKKMSRSSPSWETTAS